MSVPYAAGALDSSTEDLLRWQTSLHGGRLLTAEGLGEMGRPVREDYAMGLIRREQKGIVVLEHGGGIEGFNTQLAWQPFGLGRFAVFIAPAGPIRRRFLASKCHYATRDLRRIALDMGANPIEGPSPKGCRYPDRRITVAVLGNLNDTAPAEIAGRLGALAHGLPVDLPEPRQAVELPRADLRRWSATIN